MNAIGHNSGATDKSVSAQHLQSFVSRIERLNEEKKNLSTDLKEAYSELKSAGFDAKIVRQVIKIRAMDKADRQEMEAILQTYLDALGDLAETPLGQPAISRATGK